MDRLRKTLDHLFPLCRHYLFPSLHGDQIYRRSRDTSPAVIGVILLTCRGKTCKDTMRTVCWDKAEMGNGFCRTGKNKQTTSGVIMVMCVTYSIPPLCPFVQGVSHSHREKQIYLFWFIFWMEPCCYYCLHFHYLFPKHRMILIY